MEDGYGIGVVAYGGVLLGGIGEVDYVGDKI